ncbi:MarR family winged helix-turn-helix transcriptional regulator [Spirosoma aerolatum]|uniref:MarR family winged helix-turn-helix transcriptional regulator n=1 Tax=Spirosoma aerolatum TaxID=1211326 RepID=UPI0009ACF6B1|nr:MarR family transcriptional regulator [Spirosoma aerolatum]
MESKRTSLKLEDQLCFPLYTASRLVTQCYAPILNTLGITYPQYLVLLVLWENDAVNLSFIAQRLQLQSNTLTPLLKRMQELGLITRTRSETDERNIVIALTDNGKALRQEAAQIPLYLADKLPLSAEEAVQLYHILYKLISKV